MNERLNQFLIFSFKYLLPAVSIKPNYITGSHCPAKRLKIRFLTGVWCLASFFLVNFYYSTFISYASASNRQPIIDQLSDIPAKPNVRVAVNYGWAIDFILSVLAKHFLNDSIQFLN